MFEPDPTYQVPEEHNGRIWNKVCQSEAFGEDMKKFLKAVTYGERSYTAIDAYQQIHKATELFGPFGDGWGVKDIQLLAEIPTKKKIRSGFIDGIQALFKVTMFYKENGECHEVVLINDIFIDASGDCCKKVVTDCITKFLSYLGFNFDIFRGRFNDNKNFDTPISSKEKEEFKSLVFNVLGASEVSRVVGYHEKRGWSRVEVEADMQKLLRKKEAKQNADSGIQPAAEASEGKPAEGENQ